MYRTAFLLTSLLPLSWGQNYWPMEVGSRWELRSGRAAMAYEVTDKSGDIYYVRWDNPWVKATFGFRISGTSVMLASLDMGQGVFQMPPDTAYFDFSRGQGDSWKNALGTMTVLNRGATVDTPSGKYSNTIAIRATDTKNTHTFWTFAPDVGPVRFGQGKDAFLLTSFRPGQGRQVSSAPARPPAATPAPAPSGPKPSGRYPLVAIDANPATTEGYGDAPKLKRARMARDSGATFLYYAPKWNELEKGEGKYDFHELEHKVQVARENNWPIALNVRVIDTNNLAMPSGYSRWKFSDPRMADRLRQLLAAIAARTEGRVQWIEIGNEVNEYFKSHRGDLSAYRELLDRVLPDVRAQFPKASFSVNFTFFAAHEMAQYRPLTDLCDFISFTYYPLNADLSFRPPSVVPGDVELMVRAAGGKRVFLQEAGYASSEQLKSSEATQAEFIRRIFSALRQYRDSIIGVNFVWMSDLPDSVVNDLTKYYRLKGNSNFREYLATLGYFDKSGRPKQAWSVFEKEARGLADAKR